FSKGATRLHQIVSRQWKNYYMPKFFVTKIKLFRKIKRENHTAIYMLSDSLSATTPPSFPELGDHWNGAGLCTEVEEEPEHPSLSQILLRKPRIELNFLSVLL
ncbi:hypothetical protein RBK84_00480, partial [Pseudomonas aeruginosa]|uniref:hypothetical protein n=1 Tax=Pseudomonas aeruginosa TaxID=287 RepID=UPI0027D3B085